MKINWGTGIAIFIIAFIGALIFVVYKSTQYTESLVIDNYYEEDLAYQKVMEKKQNTAQLTTSVKVIYNETEKKIDFVFPADSVHVIKGDVWLYNPISNKLDVKIDFNLGMDSTYNIPVKGMKSGKYRVKIDWEMNDIKYYQEEVIVI